MADIAMLVAEEYERRVKNSRKASADNGEVEINWVSCVSLATQSLKNKFMQENIELIAKWVLEPKTQIGLAASNGFFSA
ncbi:uncharacterized protein LOC8263583 [Ricinus communis]|uniref:Uncharacterized protein n=1 Tax=Ricinus communis TaxID=3988 RepID=B9T6Q9_RICCO|nr:uncharacterized protein LOC8263583 [Ricinus communis]EEF28457.1 conserved hypothetical protein [Ricinus communis]|eukprot:XP_002533928.1 uncharacterized protein LOC8263583 [Ricinus communis]